MSTPRSTDEAFLRSNGETVATYLTDAAGTTVSLADANGLILTAYTYTPYGASSASGSDTDNSQTYTGRENDGTGLLYLRARYYDPSLGRFLQPDPAGLAAGLKLYAYAYGNPVAFSDHSGLIGCPEEVPASPPGASVYDNMDTLAGVMVDASETTSYASATGSTLTSFKNLVHTGGPMDYKFSGYSKDFGGGVHLDPALEYFGNWNYGVLSAELGLTLYEAQNAAGLYQEFGKGQGVFAIQYPYGDDAKDSAAIARGYDWYMANCAQECR